MNSEKIIEEAKTYINNDKTVEETAKELGISKRAFQIHLKQLGELEPLLYELVLVKKNKNIQLGRIKGGELGKAKPRYSRELAMKIALDIINSEMTYEAASDKYGIPKSTVYDMVHGVYIPQELKDKLNVVGVANNKGVLVTDLMRRNGR
jgi:predicted DNA-binding protein YlxM (UPF0122 family)